MADLGDPIRVIEVIPADEPVPSHIPAEPQEAPEYEPDELPVEAGAR